MMSKDDVLKQLDGIYKEHLELLEVLLQDENDIEFFVEAYLKRYSDIVGGIYDFRIKQREIKSIGLDDFLNKFDKNKKEALELFFQEPLSNNEVKVFLKHDKPLPEVYQLSIENPSLQLLSLLEQWDKVKSKKVTSSFDIDRK